MKVIISHDIDHITAWEHRTDLFIPKTIVRGLVEYYLGYISLMEVAGRLKKIMFNKWQNLEDLMAFNKEHAVPSTFFIGVSNGKGLNYSMKNSKKWALKILEEGFDVGMHGISHDDFSDVKKEHDSFQRLTGIKKFGIRMHYLSCNQSTIDLLNDAHYLYDCSIPAMANPYKIKDLWEFPLQIMDTQIIEKNSKWQSLNLHQCIEATKLILNEGFETGLHYFTVLFHDIYFTDSFRTWKDWYIWLVNYLKDNRIEFISYLDAIKELEAHRN